MLVSAPESKLSITGGLSIPTLTDNVLPIGRVPMLLTAETYALRFTSSVGSLYPSVGVHIFSRSNSSSVVSLHAEETKSYFLIYSLVETKDNKERSHENQAWIGIGIEQT